MVLIGLGFKVSAAPFHVWTPDVYQGAPAPVVGLMSTAPKAAAFAVLLRFLFNATPIYRNHWILLIEILAVASMCIGNLGALLQRDVKRMLAYSSIATAGYILVAFNSLPSQDAVAAVCFYTASLRRHERWSFPRHRAALRLRRTRAHASTTSPAWPSSRPVLSPRCSASSCISQIGIPFTGGFFGKFYAFSAAVHSGHVWLAIVGVANSGVACFYYLRLLTALYSRPLTDSLTYVPLPQADDSRRHRAHSDRRRHPGPRHPPRTPPAPGPARHPNNHRGNDHRRRPLITSCQNRKAFATAKAFPTSLLLTPYALLLDVKEDDDEREQRERFNKRQTQNQEGKDTRASNPGCVPAPRLQRPSRGPDPDRKGRPANPCRDRQRSASKGCRLARLSKSRRCQEHRSQCHKRVLHRLQHRYHVLLHAPVSLAASGWLRLTVLAPSRWIGGRTHHREGAPLRRILHR